MIFVLVFYKIDDKGVRNINYQSIIIKHHSLKETNNLYLLSQKVSMHLRLNLCGVGGFLASD